MFHRHVLHTHELASFLSLLRQDLEPSKHGPHSILLTDMVCTSPERLLAADERSVGGLPWKVAGATVHQIPEELPTCWHLKAWDTLLLGNQVQCTRGRHGPGTTFKAILELRNEMRVGHDHGQGVRRGHKELRAQDHVSVRVTICSGPELGDWLACVDLLTFLVQSHVRHQLDCICEVRVGVPMPSRLRTTEVWLRHSVLAASSWSTQLSFENSQRIGSLYSAHGVVGHAKLRVRDKLLNGLKVEALLQDSQMILHAVEDLDALATREFVYLRLGQIEIRNLGATFQLRDFGGPLHHFVGKLLRRRTTVLAVVFDAEVIVDSTWVVGG
mmetsp:Transcript_60700/g.113439  ORF Transcript_60700/g.113439 Transcript_60700/m.113439 type:complete len:328 (+) Transcript_60700:634-1617(+)